MFEKQESLIVKLYWLPRREKYNLSGDAWYHLRKCRYVQLCGHDKAADQVMEDLKKERVSFISKISRYRFLWGVFWHDPICGQKLENAII